MPTVTPLGHVLLPSAFSQALSTSMSTVSKMYAFPNSILPRFVSSLITTVPDGLSMPVNGVAVSPTVTVVVRVYPACCALVAVSMTVYVSPGRIPSA